MPLVDQVAQRYGVSIGRFGAAPIDAHVSPTSDHSLTLVPPRVFFPEGRNHPERELHEIMHVVLQPPGVCIYDVPEAAMLLQVERSVASTIFGRDSDEYRKVVTWQMDTYLADEDCYLADVANYERRSWWRAGYALAKRVGVLDARLRPTWCWPTWPRNLLLRGYAYVLENRAYREVGDAA